MGYTPRTTISWRRKHISAGEKSVMLNSLCRVGLTAVLFGLLFVPNAALAQDKRVRHVQDDAKLFKKDQIEQADKLIARIKEVHKKDLFIETVAEGPEKDFNGWARE